ncbi:MAG: hypothetical protein Q9162_003440 [Coniocarpon cinnabarinum]
MAQKQHSPPPTDAPPAYPSPAAQPSPLRPQDTALTQYQPPTSPPPASARTESNAAPYYGSPEPIQSAHPAGFYGPYSQPQPQDWQQAQRGGFYPQPYYYPQAQPMYGPPGQPMMYGPQPGGPYYGQPPPGQYGTRRSGAGEGIFAGLLAALAACCCLDFLLF